MNKIMPPDYSKSVCIFYHHYPTIAEQSELIHSK